jgi:anti-sigma B factor antagonist
MEISSQKRGNTIIVTTVGRLDGYWAGHLTDELDELLRQGHHRIIVNLEGVHYLSSIGLRVLVSFKQKLKEIDGYFGLENPPDRIEKILKIGGFDLSSESHDETLNLKSISQGDTFSSESTSFETFQMGEGRDGMVCRLLGDPTLLDGCQFTERDSNTLSVPDSVMALGLGAFGHSFKECQNRFGEFLSVSGVTAYQAGDGSSICDFLISDEDYTPELQVLYGLICQGQFNHLMRFEPRTINKTISLEDLSSTILERVGAPMACMVIVAESAGLIGASLHRSPANQSQPDAPFGFPAMRDWLSFSAERLDAGSLVIACGVISHKDNTPISLMPFLRPLGGDGSHLGHVHAVPFSYVPIQKGQIDLNKTVRTLFETGPASGLLHLLCDDQDPTRLDQSNFKRGACWFSPLMMEGSE